MDKKLFIKLFLAFIAATIVGTLSHEFGHYIVAKYYGYEARINYEATYLKPLKPGEIINPGKAIAITFSGPTQTMLTGTIGLLLLFIYRKTFHSKHKLSFTQWLIIFTTLFWLRQTANFFIWLGGYFFNGKFSSSGDEIQIAKYFSLPAWTIILITGIIGAIILALITFKFIPLKQRFTFLTAGLFGGIAGYYFWLVLFGKNLIP